MIRVGVDGNSALSADQVAYVDGTRLDRLMLTMFDRQERAYVAHGIHAIEAVMLLQPSLLEGRRFRWARHAWAVHNLIGHPLMQLLAFFGLHEAAMRVHDKTVPRPKAH